MHLVEPQDEPPVKFLTKEEVERFFRVIPEGNLRDRLLFEMVYRYGLRRSEPGLIDRVKHVGGDRIWITRRKRGDSGYYPIAPQTRKLLWKYLSSLKSTGPNTRLFASRQSTMRGLSGSTVYYLFRRYAREAGLPPDKWHPHVLRHSIAAHLLDAEGVGLLDLQNWLAHKNVKSTEVYVHLSTERRARSLRLATAARRLAST